MGTGGRYLPTAAGRQVADFALVAALLALAVLGGGQVHSSQPGLLLAPLGAVAVVPLIWRRRAPVLVWAISGTAVLAAFALRETPGLIALNPLVALYSVATTSPRKVSLGVGAAAIGGALLGVALLRPASPSWLPYTFAVAVTAACWLIGDNLRVRGPTCQNSRRRPPGRKQTEPQN